MVGRRSRIEGSAEYLRWPSHQAGERKGEVIAMTLAEVYFYDFYALNLEIWTLVERGGKVHRPRAQVKGAGSWIDVG